MANAATLARGLDGYFNISEVKSLPEDERIYTVTLAELEEVGQTKEEKPVLGFRESRKKLVLNKSRTEQCQALFGEDDLVGKQIRLGVENIKGREQIVISSAE